MPFGAFITAAKPFLLSGMTKQGIARFEKETGQEEVLASCSGDVVFDLHGPHDDLLRRRLRGQAIHINAAVVVGDVDLATVDDGRIEFVEQERNVPLLRVPEDGDRLAAVGIGDAVVRIVDEQAAVGDGGVGVAVRDSAEKQRGSGGGSVAGHGAEAAGHATRGICNIRRCKFVALCEVSERAGGSDRPGVELAVLSPGEEHLAAGGAHVLDRGHVHVAGFAPGKEIQGGGILGAGVDGPGSSVSQTGGEASLAQLVLALAKSAGFVLPRPAILVT